MGIDMAEIESFMREHAARCRLFAAQLQKDSDRADAIAPVDRLPKLLVEPNNN